MVFQLSEKLNTQKSVEWHEEQEEESHIVYLLTGPPGNRKTILFIVYLQTRNCWKGRNQFYITICNVGVA